MYLRTDEESEAVEALRMATDMLIQVPDSPSHWRWVIVALHNSVQGFMVLSLRHGNGLLALSSKSFQEWMDAYENDKPFPKKEKLDSYSGLYKKVKSEDAGQAGGNSRFIPTGTQGRSIKRLDALRNDFIHFTPKGWSLELDGLPEICRDALVLVSFLGWKSENIHWHSPDSKEQAQVAHYTFEKRLDDVQSLYSSFGS